MARWWEKSNPEDIKPIPWLHVDTIAYFESILQSDFHVIEAGAGGSTLWLAERVARVVSYENNPEWRAAIESQAPENVDMRTGSIFMEWEEFNLHKFNLLFIDNEPVENRGVWLMMSPEIVKPGGWVVLDNANRPEFAGEREQLKNYAELVQTINRNTPGTKYFVTEFWRLNENREQPTQGSTDEAA